MDTEPITIHVPRKLVPLIAARMKAEGYASRSNYGVSLLLFDLWCERRHQFITPRDFEAKQIEGIADEIVAAFGKKEKTGAWIDHRLEELVAEKLLREKARTNPPTPK